MWKRLHTHRYWATVYLREGSKSIQTRSGVTQAARGGEALHACPQQGLDLPDRDSPPLLGNVEQVAVFTSDMEAVEWTGSTDQS